MAFIKNIFKWCIDHNGMLMVFTPILITVYYSLQIIKTVGFTIDIPKYWEFFNGLELSTKVYVFAGANLVFTIVFVLLMDSTKKKESTKGKEISY